jgi:hypothetical protein
VALAACGAQAAPLALEERVLTADDAPGSEPDPVETPQVMDGFDEFEAVVLVDVPSVTEEDLSALEEAGLVAAISDARFYPDEPGGAHSREAVHAFSLVMQFGDADGPSEVVERMQAFNLQTCPDTCAFASAEFTVDGIPDALGAQRIATQESLDEVGDPGDPLAVYVIDFVDGAFLYQVELSGPPDEVSEEEAEELARTLHARVAGAPPAEPD